MSVCVVDPGFVQVCLSVCVVMSTSDYEVSTNVCNVDPVGMVLTL